MSGASADDLISPRSAARAAYATAALNVVAAAALLLVMKPGLPVEGSTLEARMAFVRERTVLWCGGWLLWHGATIALLAFYVGLAGTVGRRSPLASAVAVVCAGAGLAADFAAQSISMGLAPTLGPAAFEVAEGVVSVVSGYLGNGLYTLAGAILVWAGRAELPRPLVLLSLPAWVAGFALSAACLARSPAAQLASTAVLFPTFVLWSALVGRWLSARGS